MKPAPFHPKERERIAHLQSYRLLDTEADEKFDRLTRLASSLTGSPIATLSLVDTDRQWFKSRVGLDDHEGPRETAFCAHAILGDDVMVVEDATKDERFADNPLVTDNPNIRFYAGVPLVTKKGLGLGTLCIIDRKPRKLTAEHRRILEDLAGMAVDEMELHRNLRMLKESKSELEKTHANLQDANKRLEVMAATDGLTELANRRALDEAMDVELKRSKRTRSPLSLLLIDVDHFKKYNDRYGHRDGDTCLKAVALVLKSVLRRPVDLAARYGGEEFAVLLPETDAEGAMAVAEAVRGGVISLNLKHEGSEHRRVTVSIGVTTLTPKKNDTVSEMVVAADKALYRAKEGGRNACCSAQDVAASEPAVKRKARA